MQEARQAFHYAASADTSTLQPDAASIDRFLTAYVPTLIAETVAMRDSTLLNDNARDALDMFKEGMFRDGVRDRLLPKYIKSDETVVREVYERMKTQLELAVIRVPTLVEIDSVQADLQRGVPFDEVARHRSRDSSNAAYGGTMGWLDAARFPPDQQKVLWSLPVGGVSSVISDPTFHSIYKVLDRRDGPPLKSLAEEHDTIVRTLSISQAARAAAQIHDDLMAAYHYHVDMDAAEWMRGFLQKETAAVRRTYDPKIDKSYVRLDQPGEKPLWSEAPLKGADAARPVAFVDGDTLHALEVIDQLVFEPSLVWPPFDHVSDVGDLCDDAFYERIQIREGQRLGIDKEPEFVRKLTNQRGLLAWRAYRRVVLLPKIRPSEDTLRAIYAREVEHFNLPERRRWVAVGTPTVDLAQQAASLLRTGMAPSNVGPRIATPEVRVAITPDTGMGLSIYGQNPGLDSTVFGLKQDQVSEPVPDRGGYAVIRVDEILPARTEPFEEVRKGLENRITAPLEKKAIAEIAAQAAPSTKVWIDRDALSKMDFKLSVFQQRGKPRQSE